jgi:hypothetical protein
MPRAPFITPRQFVFNLHACVAVASGAICAMYLHLGWWSLAIGLAIILALELALLSRRTAWFSLAVSVASSAAAGFAAGAVIAISLTNVHAIWWIAGALGIVPGGWLMLDAHRKLRPKTPNPLRPREGGQRGLG